MDLHVALYPGDLLYWFGWAAALFVLLFPLWIGSKLGLVARRKFERGWALVLVGAYLVMTGLTIARGEFSWGSSLLFHMCGFSRLLLIGYFFTGKRWMGELVTFTGIAGGLQSLLTPEFTHGINFVYAFDYYVNHASIIGVGFYIIVVQHRRLKKRAWLRSFGRIQLMALIALGVNLLTGGNYMYLMEPPIADNPLIITSENFAYLHVVFFEVFAALNFWLIQLLLSRIHVKNSLGYRTV